MKQLEPSVADKISMIIRKDFKTQDEFAKKIGVLPYQLSMIVRGHVIPTPQTLEKIAEVTGYDYAWLAGDHQGGVASNAE